MSNNARVRDVLDRSRAAHMRLRDTYHLVRGRLLEGDLRRWLMGQLAAQAQEVQLAIGKFLGRQDPVLEQWLPFPPDQFAQVDEVVDSLNEDLDPEDVIRLGVRASNLLSRVHEQLATGVGAGPAVRDVFEDLAGLTTHHARQRSRYMLDQGVGRPSSSHVS